MNIWLISIFENTPIDNVFSTRFLCIGDEVFNRGHQITFFASTFKHNVKKQRYDKTTSVAYKPGYEIVFVKSDAYYDNISLKRMMAHDKFGKDLVHELKKKPKPDIILMAFPPISMAYQVTRWAKENGVPVILDIIDPWPDIFKNAIPKPLKSMGNIVLFPMARRLKAVLDRITAVTAISNQYLHWAKSYNPKLKNLHCFYPAADFLATRSLVEAALIRSPKDSKSFAVTYAGSLASSYDIPCILGAAAILEKKYGNRIMFLIAGVGPQQPLVEDYESNNSNLKYYGRIPKEQLMEVYANCDLGLTQHIKGATQSVTYKLFDLLASGLPILNSLESEMWDLIANNKVGLNNKPGDSEQLAKNIEYFYENKSVLAEFKTNGMELTKQIGDTVEVYKQMVNLIESYSK